MDMFLYKMYVGVSHDRKKRIYVVPVHKSHGGLGLWLLMELPGDE